MQNETPAIPHRPVSAIGVFCQVLLAILFGIGLSFQVLWFQQNYQLRQVIYDLQMTMKSNDACRDNLSNSLPKHIQ